LENKIFFLCIVELLTHSTHDDQLSISFLFNKHLNVRFLVLKCKKFHKTDHTHTHDHWESTDRTHTADYTL